MKKKIAFFLYLISGTLTINAQQTKGNYNALFWRVSGNGLSKPSYVFGTMHLTDKRVFHFTDSLYKNLEECEGFAAELDMGSIMSTFLKEFMKGDDDGNSHAKKLLIDSIGKEKLIKYKTKLEKQFGKPLNKIEVKEIEKEERKLKNELLSRGDMSTFMDAWLFDIAKRQGKWVGGIEDPEDQLGLEATTSLEDKIKGITEDKTQMKKILEWMIKTYINQDLESIDLSNKLWQGSKDIILTRRNIKMARRMDSLSHIRSTFFAVGAAHIPGQEGVVNLLKKNGFTVTPIFSSNSIAPENYTFKQVELPWYDVVSTDSSYALKMPGKPDYFPDFKQAALDMKVYFDLGSMTGYFTVSMPVSIKANKDSMLNDLVKYYKNKGVNTIEKNILIYGQRGKEIIGTEDGSELRTQIFIQPSFLVLNIISGYKRSALFGDEPDRFFQSLKINTNASKVINKKTKNWQRYNFDKFNFSIELPSQYKNVEIESQDSWETKFFQSVDVDENVFMGMIISSVKQGYYSSSDSMHFEQTAENMLKNMDGKLLSNEHFFKNGYPAMWAIGKSSAEKGNVTAKILFINKGPWRYILYTVSEQNNPNSEAAELFFASFNFLPEKNSDWKRSAPADKTFSIWAPSVVVLSEEKNKKGSKYFIYDTISKAQIFIDKEVFPSYFWAVNDSTLLKDKMLAFIGKNDSVIYNKVLKNGKIIGGDLLVKLNGTHNHKRLKVFLNGDTVYTVYSYLPLQYLEVENYKRLFDDFKINSESVSTSLYQRKPEALFQALQTKDSTDFETAKEVFEYVNFSQEDIPVLQKALLYAYYDFDTNYYYNTNKLITELIEKIDTTNSSILFVEEEYEKLIGEKEVLKPYLLGLLSQVKTKESYERLKKLILKYPPAISTAYYFRNGLYDSLMLTKTLYPEVLTLSADPGLYDFINDLTLSMIDSNIIDVSMLLSHKNSYVKTAERVLAFSREQQQENFYRYRSLVKLLSKINMPETNELVRKFGKINANYLKLDVILALAGNNQGPNTKDVYVLAKSDEFRSDLYEGLRKVKRQNLFPVEFLSQRLLAQSVVYRLVLDDDYTPDLIEYFGERMELLMGKKQRVYLYKIYFEDEEGNESCYLGIAGPYSPDLKNYTSNHEVSKIYWDETFDAKKADIWVREIIERVEERLKNKIKK